MKWAHSLCTVPHVKNGSSTIAAILQRAPYVVRFKWRQQEDTEKASKHIFSSAWKLYLHATLHHQHEPFDNRATCNCITNHHVLRTIERIPGNMYVFVCCTYICSARCKTAVLLCLHPRWLPTFLQMQLCNHNCHWILWNKTIQFLSFSNWVCIFCSLYLFVFSINGSLWKSTSFPQFVEVLIYFNVGFCCCFFFQIAKSSKNYGRKCQPSIFFAY